VTDPAVLGEAVGGLTGWLQQLSRGIDDRPVVPSREARSSGSETTYAEDLTDYAAIRREVAAMAVEAARWLARRDLFARTVTVKVRFPDFATITRSHTAAATRTEASLVARSLSLLDRTDARTRPVRLLGVSVHNLLTDEPPCLPESCPDGWLPFDEPPAPSSESA
jgi:DNA polymerase-4